MDAHLGAHVPHEEALPDMTLDVVHATLWTDRPGAPRARVHSPLMTVFCKVMPENGQPRELNRFVLKAAAQSADAAAALHAVVACALLGNYRHCRFKPALAARRSIVDTFGVQEFLDALAASPQGNLLMFYVLREFFYVIGKYVASYRVLMGALFMWEKQSSRVCDMMQDVREIVSQRGDWRVAFFDAEVTELLKRHYRRLPKKKLATRAPCMDRLLKHVLERNVRLRALRTAGAGALEPARAAAAHALGDRRAPAALLRAMGDGAAADALAAVVALIQAAPTPSKAANVEVAREVADDRALAAMHDAALVAHHANCIFVVQLPPAFVAKQVAAAARRFGCGERDVSVLRRVARVYVCPNCARVKNFFVTAKDYDKATRVRACGFEKLVHPSALDWAGVEADTAPPDGNAQLACATNEACRAYRATAHDLVAFAEDGSVSGGVLQTTCESITISPCCGVLTTTNALRVRADPPGFECPVCAAVR